MSFVSTALGNLLTAQPLDAPKVTGTIDTSKADQLVLQTRLTRGGALTAVVLTVEESEDGVTWSDVQGESAGALTPLTLTRTTSASENFSTVLDVSHYQNVRVTFTGTAATAPDVITVLGRVARG